VNADTVRVHAVLIARIAAASAYRFFDDVLRVFDLVLFILLIGLN